MGNAIQSVFKKGYDNLIVIGNDCPTLTSSLILETNERLKTENLVLGPATDGGIYLIGLNKAAYNHQKFISLSWKTKDLQHSLENYAKNIQIEVKWLKIEQDIDNALDFKIFLATTAKHSILGRWVQALLASYQSSQSKFTVLFHSAAEYSSLGLRAPPY